LPEAQLDRFLFKVEVDYPSLQEEISILNNQQSKGTTQLLDMVRKILSAADIRHYRSLVQEIIIEPKLIEFIAKIVNETRNNPSLYLGASPRASFGHSAKRKSKCGYQRA
jgi:MoxR-like ATPase